ncbi:MAG TPA: hypothetical protein VIT91_22035 [Chthoniobacterales bacterium]
MNNFGNGISEMACPATAGQPEGQAKRWQIFADFEGLNREFLRKSASICEICGLNQCFLRYMAGIAISCVKLLLKLLEKLVRGIHLR